MRLPPRAAGTFDIISGSRSTLKILWSWDRGAHGEAAVQHNKREQYGHLYSMETICMDTPPYMPIPVHVAAPSRLASRDRDQARE